MDQKDARIDPKYPGLELVDETARTSGGFGSSFAPSFGHPKAFEKEKTVQPTKAANPRRTHDERQRAGLEP